MAAASVLVALVATSSCSGGRTSTTGAKNHGSSPPTTATAPDSAIRQRLQGLLCRRRPEPPNDFYTTTTLDVYSLPSLRVDPILGEVKDFGPATVTGRLVQTEFSRGYKLLGRVVSSACPSMRILGRLPAHSIQGTDYVPNWFRVSAPVTPPGSAPTGEHHDAQVDVSGWVRLGSDLRSTGLSVGTSACDIGSSDPICGYFESYDSDHPDLTPEERGLLAELGQLPVTEPSPLAAGGSVDLSMGPEESRFTENSPCSYAGVSPGQVLTTTYDVAVQNVGSGAGAKSLSVAARKADAGSVVPIRLELSRPMEPGEAILVKGPFQAGTVASVDPGNEVAESNEDNNVFRFPPGQRLVCK